MQRTNIRFLLPLVSVLALVACKPQGTADTAADKAALQTAAESWINAYNDKNADGVAATYSDDGRLLPPGAAAVSGGTAIHEYWTNDIATQWAKISIKEEGTEVMGDWAWREGTWSIEGPPAMGGKYLEVWKRTPQGWRLHRDIWNMDAPVAAPAVLPAAPAAQ